MRLNTTHAALATLALLAPCLFGSCGGKTGVLPGPAAGASFSGLFPPPSELAQLPADSAARAASSSQSIVQAGAAYDLSLPLQHVAPGIGTAVFSPATVAGDEFNTMAYAVYRLNALGYTGASEIKAYFDPAPASGEAWYGVANFSRNRWDWYQRIGAPPRSIGSVSEHRNALGTMFVAMVVLGSTPAELHLLRLGEADLLGEVVQSPKACIAPWTVTLDASGVYVDGTSITGYKWDYNNDGTDDDTIGTPQTTRLYPSPGDFPCRLTVQTALNDTVMTVFNVHIMTGIWEATTVAYVASSSYHYYSPHLALIGDKPMLAYIAQFDGDPPDFPAYKTVELLAAADRLAHSWHYAIQPKPQQTHQRIYSLVEAGGLPYVLAANVSGYESPEVMFALDQTLLQWGDTIYPDPLTGTEREADLAMVAGNLALAFRDSTNRIIFNLRYGPDFTVSAGKFDTTWDCNGTLSLADVNGHPAIACTRFSGVEEIVYLYSTSPTGELGTWSVYFDEISHTQTPSLAYLGGTPVLAADDLNDLLIAVGDAPDGTANLWRSITPGWGNGIGDWCSVAGPCLDGLAAVASQNQQYKSLEFTLVHDDGVTLSGALSTIDEPLGVDVGQHCDMMCVDGVPMVAYEDTTNQAVKVAVMR